MGFTEDEEKYIEIMASGTKLESHEMAKIFGPDNYGRYNVDQRLAKEIAERKANLGIKVNCAERIRADQVISLRDIAISGLKEIACDMEHKDRLAAIKELLTLDRSYMNALGKAVGEKDGGYEEKSAEIKIFIDGQDAKL